MEKLDQFDSYLKQTLSVKNANILAPDLALMNAARKTIINKKRKDEADDIFAHFASFLNMKIKLYHAVIASICLALVIFFITKTEKPENIESNKSEYVSNIASVRSSTVLSSIRTFAVKN